MRINYVIGTIIALSLIQGGEAPSCFSKAVVDYIVHVHVRNLVDVGDIPDHDMQNSLNEVQYIA